MSFSVTVSTIGFNISSGIDYNQTYGYIIFKPKDADEGIKN